MRLLLVICLGILMLQSASSQSRGYGIRFGTGISSQKWQGGDQRKTLLVYHVDFYNDSESETGNIFYWALGYHQRGSSIRFNRFIDQNGNVFAGGSYGMKFHQIGIELGVKKAKASGDWKLNYGIGIRGETTVKSQLELFQEYKPFIKKFTYGFSASGAAERKLNKFAVIGFEARVSPDVSRQIYVPASIPWYDPYSGIPRPGIEQSIRNLGIEFSLYIKFLQLIQYID